MPFLRILLWTTLLGATAFAGPNMPGQALQAFREATRALFQYVFTRPAAR